MLRSGHLSLLAALLLPPQPTSVDLRRVHDVPERLTLQVPADWPLSTHDRELSTFHQEARTAPRAARLRLVAAMPENPYPESTFSGAHLYLSVTRGQTETQCAAQAGPARTQIAGLWVSQGHDEHGSICTQYRDDIYTVRRKGACLRFDLALNNFCGGEVSGVRDLTPEQILAVQQRLRTILDSLRFER